MGWDDKFISSIKNITVLLQSHTEIQKHLNST
jgi:hypothetical protein